MKIGMIQIPVSEDAQANLKLAQKGIAQCALQQADLIVLPEFWNTPFDLEAIARHKKDGNRFLKTLQEEARAHRVWILGGTLPYEEDGRVFNRAFLIDDLGQIVSVCDKCHLLEVHTSKTDYHESDVITQGDHLCRADTPWGKAGIVICYDIRFPEMARLLCQEAVLLLVPACFNEAVGAKHWKPLLQSRAMENQVFVVGVNPAAKHYDTYSSYGHSLICDPDGQIVWEMGPDDFVHVAEIDLEQVQKIRKRAPYWKVRRTDLYSLKEREKDEKNSCQ